MAGSLLEHYKLRFFNEQNYFYGVEHNLCRTRREIFLAHEVFNTSVDKPVKNRLVPAANSTYTNKLVLFALF
jgi:hypothetical protein